MMKSRLWIKSLKCRWLLVYFVLFFCCRVKHGQSIILINIGHQKKSQGSWGVVVPSIKASEHDELTAYCSKLQASMYDAPRKVRITYLLWDIDIDSDTLPGVDVLTTTLLAQEKRCKGLILFWWLQSVMFLHTIQLDQKLSCLRTFCWFVWRLNDVNSWGYPGTIIQIFMGFLKK
jgi:hypothetical protein